LDGVSQGQPILRLTQVTEFRGRGERVQPEGGHPAAIGQPASDVAVRGAASNVGTDDIANKSWSCAVWVGILAKLQQIRRAHCNNRNLSLPAKTRVT
jgi:hypothetical protein